MLRFYVVFCSLSWYVVVFECSIGVFFAVLEVSFRCFAVLSGMFRVMFSGFE